MIKCIIVLSIFFLASCATELASINNSLGSVNNTLSGANTNIASKVAYPKSQLIRNEIDSAMPFITNMLGRISCKEG